MKISTNAKNFVEIVQGMRRCKAFIFRNLILKFLKFSFLWATRRTSGMKFGVEESTFGQISPHRCSVSPLRGEKKLKIALLTELNNSALRAMLAVIAGRAPGRIHSNVPFNQKGSVIAEQAEEENQG